MTMEADGSKTIGLEIAGHAEFDAAAGTLLSRETMMVGRYTAGSAGASPADHFREVGSLQAIDPAPAPAVEAEPKVAPSP
jgi:hypothetical protein